MNEKLLEILINLLWPKILAAYGDQIQEAIKLAFSFKTFADELTARFERIENRLTNIERILEHAHGRNNAFANGQLAINGPVIDGTAANSTGGGNGIHAGNGNNA